MPPAEVMNMLIGVLVEVVSVTAQVDKEETAMKALEDFPLDSHISVEVFSVGLADPGEELIELGNFPSMVE